MVGSSAVSRNGARLGKGEVRGAGCAVRASLRVLHVCALSCARAYLRMCCCCVQGFAELEYGILGWMGAVDQNTPGEPLP